MRQRSISVSVGRREQELDTVRLERNYRRAYVAQQHVRFSKETDDLLFKYEVTPVVLTRSLFDVVASFRDHIRTESPVAPMAWLTDEHAALPDADLEQTIADLVMPWYVNFFVSWQSCDRALQVGYDEVRCRPESVVSRIASHAGIRANDRDISAAVSRAAKRPRRMNKGVAGRGKSISPNAIRHIKRLTAHYPSIDFSPVGIPPR